ncbi:MAG: 2-hydroxyacyl-CoA dehydratase [Clostridia bacterium]|nr:2-hydroxyacyl-CoA dehydratase [Clostridia bacterium]
MIYTTCKYVPEELFSGFGEKVCRLDPNPVSFSCADGCSHPNLCGFAKAVIEEVKAQDIKTLIFTDCCDAMRRTFDVLLCDGIPFLYLLPLPHKTGTAETSFFAADLKKLADAYAEYSGKSFSWERAYAACFENVEKADGSDKYVSVLGAHGGKMLIDRVRAALPTVSVRDETCSSDRFFKKSAFGEAPKDERAFFLWYARLILSGLTPCMRMYDVKERGGLFDEERQKRRTGIIYHTMKFCDYYGFEYSDIKGRARVPVLKIETDTTPQSSGQLKTRIEAFGETLGVKKYADAPASAEIDALYVAGVDSGSASTDAVIMDKDRKIVGSTVIPTGMSASKSAAEALSLALFAAGLGRERLAAVVATGYGREAVDTNRQTVTEITCHALGAHFLFPNARTVIDIGGQDSKIIRIDREGNVLGFVMNDKCAAGTGRFLEMQARALGLSIDEMSLMGLSWKNDVRISNMCTVFAESEVVSLVAKDTPVSDIIHGLNVSVAEKTASLVARGGGGPGYAMTGGVAKNSGVVKCLSEKLGAPVMTSPRSQLCGAVGAALIALSSLEKSNV